jgi:hypothetical protein
MLRRWCDLAAKRRRRLRNKDPLFFLYKILSFINLHMLNSIVVCEIFLFDASLHYI